MRQRIWYWQCPTNHRWLIGGLCLVLAKFMAMWRWENELPNKFLNWNLKMMQAMCCYQIYILPLVTGISTKILNGRERKEV
jgi:ABC-type proline/glycine betaine transport system permease subunit